MSHSRELDIPFDYPTTSHETPNENSMNVDDNLPIPIGNRRPKRRSEIWNHYSLEPNGVYALCKYCNTRSPRKQGNTSGLWRHLELHKIKKTVIQQTPEDAGTAIQTQETKFMDPKSLRAKEINNQIAKMMASDLEPYSLVNRTGFKNLIHFFEPCYKLPSPTTFSRTIMPELYQKTKEKVSSQISADMSNGVSGIALTTDGWTSRPVQSYLSLTLHYLDKDFNLKHYDLGLTYHPERMLSSNIHTFLKDKIKEWLKVENIASDIEVFIVTDNAPNMARAISLSAEWTRIPCFAHLLNLVVNDCCKHDLYEHLRKKCRSIVGYFARSSNAREILMQTQKQLFPDSEPLCLIQDVPTRWNSTHDSFSRLIELKKAVNFALIQLDSDLELSVDEWSRVEAFVDIFQPLKEVTEIMCGDKYTTLSSYIPMVAAIQSVDEHNNKPMQTELATLLKSSIEKRFTEITKSNAAIKIAMALDPRYKDFLLDEDEKSALFYLILEKIPQHNGQAITSDRHNTDGEAISKIAKFLKNLHKQNCAQTNGAEQELRQYLREPAESDTTDPLAWWRCNKARFPRLGNLALKYLGIPATQVSSERLFSVAGNIVTESRVKLLSENVEILAFLHGNI